MLFSHYLLGAYVVVNNINLSIHKYDKTKTNEASLYVFTESHRFGVCEQFFHFPQEGATQILPQIHAVTI